MVAEWLAATVMALWVGVLLHEAGHILPALFLFSGGLSATAPSWARGMVFAGGPAVTLAITCWACWLVTHYREGRTVPSPIRVMFAVAFGLGAVSRPILLAFAARSGQWNGDETALAHEFGVATKVFFTFELLVALPCAYWLVRAIPRPRALSLAAVVIGIFVGWMTVVTFGPRLGLPI
jgi:hypothetical protein